MTLFLTTPTNHRIAYRSQVGEGRGVLFLHGFRSDMHSTKATALGEFCARERIPFTALDCFAHGKSDGDFVDFTIGRALGDVLAMLDEVVRKPVILVGSSMGGWLALLAALQRRELVRGIVGVAPAPDFTDRMRGRMSGAQQAELDRDGVVWVPSDDGPDYPIAQSLIDDGRKHFLMQDLIPLDIPVHICQGMRDDSVPWETALSIAQKLTSRDVTVTLIKDADHRQNRPEDLAMLMAAVRGIIPIDEVPS